VSESSEAGRHASYCEGFSDACITTATPKHRQQASEKRQGTKSREVGQGTVQRRLWRFRRVDAGRERGEEAFRWAIGV
jgi:hypothetical protein